MELFQVDAFTAAPFTGNPAAVCLLTTQRDAAWMQNVAKEMNLSETAFVQRQRDGRFRLRWFTPTHEVDLCGHATLASAHMLWETGRLAPEEEARFVTESGVLTATQSGGWITLDFPADPPAPASVPKAVLAGLGVEAPVYTGRSDRDLVVRVESAATVRRLAPDMDALTTADARGIIVTAPANGVDTDDDVDFVSRFFGPAVGVPEDPVTGSAHCALGPYWAGQTGRTRLVGRQVSARSGLVRVHLKAPDADRVHLSGQAVTVLHGRLVGG